MTNHSYVQLDRDDLARLLFALGYTKTGLRLEDGANLTDDSLIDAGAMERLSREINEQWHDERDHLTHD